MIVVVGQVGEGVVEEGEEVVEVVMSLRGARGSVRERGRKLGGGVS